MNTRNDKTAEEIIEEWLVWCNKLECHPNSPHGRIELRGKFMSALKSAYSEGEARGYEKGFKAGRIDAQYDSDTLPEVIGARLLAAKAEGIVEGMRRAAEIAKDCGQGGGYDCPCAESILAAAEELEKGENKL